MQDVYIQLSEDESFRSYIRLCKVSHTQVTLGLFADIERPLITFEGSLEQLQNFAYSILGDIEGKPFAHSHLSKRDKEYLKFGDTVLGILDRHTVSYKTNSWSISEIDRLLEELFEESEKVNRQLCAIE